MAYSTIATQTMYSFTYSFQSEWRQTDSRSIHPSLSFYWCTTFRCSRLLDYSRPTFALGDTEVRPAETIATLESTLTAVGPIGNYDGSCESTRSSLYLSITSD